MSVAVLFFHRFVLAVGLLAAVACSGEVRTPRHLLLITVDTLRADHLGLYGYRRATSPVIDELGRHGVVFENAIVQWPATTPSMVSMFSGTYPQKNGIVILAYPQHVPDELEMFPEVLQARGFRTAAVIGNGVLGRESNFRQGFEVYRELWMDRESYGPRPKEADHATDVALELLAGLADSGDRFLLWVHYIDPHLPYVPPAGYAERFMGDAHFRSQRAPVNADNQPWKGIPHQQWEKADKEDDLAVYVARYDGEIRFVDDQIGRLLRELERRSLAEETLVAFTSDHGESLGEHDYYLNHGHLAYEEQVRVPLVFRWPGGRYGGCRIAKPVELRGLAPTLLEAMGVPAEEIRHSAPSLLPAIRGEGEAALPESVFTEAGSFETRKGARYTLAVRKGSRKLVLPRSKWARERAGGRTVELYHLASDPAEAQDLAGAHPGEVAQLRRELRAWIRSSQAVRRKAPPQPARVRDETRRALRELGYIE
jgi:arylsulfatase A-like enzyme